MWRNTLEQHTHVTVYLPSQVVSPDLIYVQTSLTVVRDLANLSSSIAENELQPLTGAMVCALCMQLT